MAVVETLPTQPMSEWANSIYKQKYAHPEEEWEGTATRVAENVLGALGYGPDSDEVECVSKLIAERKFIPGGRYLYASGRELHQVNNCLMLRAEDSREGWSTLVYKSMMALMTGAGIGINYGKVRASGTPIKKTGGVASGPLSLMQMVNEVARHVMQGGSRRAAVWAGLPWWHPDIFDFITIKNWDDETVLKKSTDFNHPATLDMTNISILLDDDFFTAYEAVGPIRLHDSNTAPNGMEWNDWASLVYKRGVSNMVRTAEPGFGIDIGDNAGEDCRNACTELTTSDDSDICNLGSINLANIDSKEELAFVVDQATLFLLAGTVYSHVPYPKVAETRNKNRRLGLGVMGVHEWLLKRELPYAPDEELAEWMDIYTTSAAVSHKYADKHGLSRPVKTRAIAPTGTISICAETTSGIEPIFCVAFKRRYLTNGVQWKYQYVIDPTAQRLINEGVDPDLIEDAYSLSHDVEKRIAFQAWMQSYVDHAISVTINIPGPMTDSDDVRKFSDMLYYYLPQLRGITVYPDGARGGQPISAVPYEEAASQVGVVFEEDEAGSCKNGICSI